MGVIHKFHHNGHHTRPVGFSGSVAGHHGLTSVYRIHTIVHILPCLLSNGSIIDLMYTYYRPTRYIVSHLVAGYHRLGVLYTIHMMIGTLYMHI